MADEQKKYLSEDDMGFGAAPKVPKQKYLSESDMGFTEPKGFMGHARDLGLSVLQGAIGVPEAAVGLADIPTGGAVGKALENEGGRAAKSAAAFMLKL